METPEKNTKPKPNLSFKRSRPPPFRFFLFNQQKPAKQSLQLEFLHPRATLTLLFPGQDQRTKGAAPDLPHPSLGCSEIDQISLIFQQPEASRTIGLPAPSTAAIVSQLLPSKLSLYFSFGLNHQRRRPRTNRQTPPLHSLIPSTRERAESFPHLHRPDLLSAVHIWPQQRRPHLATAAPSPLLAARSATVE